MAVSKRLRADLLKAMGDITPRRLNQVASARAQDLLITHEQAIYTIAHERGLRLGKYLTKEEMADVRPLVTQSRPTPQTTAPSASARGKKNGSVPARSEIALNKIKIPAGVLSERHRRDAEQMAVNVYPLLYAFENSAREFIDGHLTATYGPDWWDDPKLVSKPVRDGVEISRKAEHENRTHSARNARPIYYTSFGDLVLIVQSEKGAKVFKRPLFPRPTWFPELVKASEHTRNIVAHMNPLRQQDTNRLEMNFKDWLNQIKGHLPSTVP